MSKVIIFSRNFPAYHPKAGLPTYFVEKIWAGFAEMGIVGNLESMNKHPNVGLWEANHEVYAKTSMPKYHTIRAGSSWKVGDKFSPRIWTGKPYKSPQCPISDDIEIKKVWDFEVETMTDDGEHDCSVIKFQGKHYTVYGYGGYDAEIIVDIAKNDGLVLNDFLDWFTIPLERSDSQKLRGEESIFKGQIICWNQNIDY